VGEFLSRDHLDEWNSPGRTASVIMPGNVDLHRGTLTLLSRPLKGLRIKAQYSYATAGSAVYGSAFEERHQGSFLASYSAPGRWGVTANTRITREGSDHLTISSIDLTDPISFATFQQPRERRLNNATLTLWFAPLRALTISGSYGFLRNRTDQGVLFAGTRPASNSLADYTTQAQVYSVSAVYTPAEMLDLSLLLQQVRSFSRFVPGIADAALSSEVQGISQLSTRENSLSARGEYRFTKNFSCLLDYSYRDYDDKTRGSLSGTVHAVSASVRAKW
jgi:hypothetical protein